MRVTFAEASRPAVRAATAVPGACAEADVGRDPASAAPTTPPSDFAKLLRLTAISPHAIITAAHYTRRLVIRSQRRQHPRRRVCDDSAGEESGMTRCLMALAVGVAAAATSLTGQTQTGAAGRAPARQGTPLVVMSPKAKS